MYRDILNICNLCLYIQYKLHVHVYSVNINNTSIIHVIYMYIISNSFFTMLLNLDICLIELFLIMVYFLFFKKMFRSEGLPQFLTKRENYAIYYIQ